MIAYVNLADMVSMSSCIVKKVIESFFEQGIGICFKAVILYGKFQSLPGKGKSCLFCNAAYRLPGRRNNPEFLVILCENDLAMDCFNAFVKISEVF